MGRFLQTDPLGYADGMNMYAYVGNNPVNFVDPWGLCGTKTISDYFWEEVYKNNIRQDWHFDRNKNQPYVPSSKSEAENSGWKKQAGWANSFHKYGPGNENNVKYLSPDGHMEAIYNGEGALVTDPINKGTYNYGTDPLSHFFLDMVPYFIYGNDRK